MAKFKIGDKVRRIEAGGGCPPIKMGETYTVKGYTDDLVMVEEVGGQLFEHRFELAISLEESALALLNSLGYTIAPPKPKLTGKLYVYSYDDGSGPISLCRKLDNPAGTLIAIVDWAEGQGIDIPASEPAEPDGSF